jgi:4-carboxymuconolactone decarboxylase
MAKLPSHYQQFRDRFPEIAEAYDEVSRLTVKAGSLDAKSVQLVRLAMALGAGHEGAVHSHARRALEAGATREEVRQVGLLGLTTMGFPRTMAGLSWIDDVVRAAPGAKRKTRRKN